ncbi:MAG: phage holin family protein [Zoogloeaceae bacterium]|jgi:uncharacterized membrane protein YqjE|nr:phage holin family protein [Zoogloeaceae bacterium]
MQDRPGFFQTLKRLLHDLLEVGQTRLALFANEAEEERIRLVRTFVLCILALFFLSVGVVLLVAFLTLLFWESRLLLLGAVSLGFLALAAVLIGRCRASLRRGLLFAATLAELQRDIASLRGETAPDVAGEPHDVPSA